MAAATERKRRSVWWAVHAWAGLKLSLFMTFILATGTLAVFSAELDWLVTPSMRVMPQEGAKASWGTLAASARDAVPGGRLAQIYAPPHPGFAAEAWLDTSTARPTRVHLDPYTGRVTGVVGWYNIQRFLRETHRHLMLPVKLGVPIVCTLAFLLLASLVSGIVTYKKWWRGFFKRPRGGDGRRLSGDLHRLAGLWSLWFVALIAVTGVWYMVESLGGDAPDHPRAPALSITATQPVGPALDALIEAGLRAYPGLDIREIRYPTAKGGRGLVLMGQADAWLVRDRSNAVWLNPDDGAVLLVSSGEELTAHQRISEMADPLHFGTLGGYATKIVWFLAGILLTGLSVTGVMIYSMRLRAAVATGAESSNGWVRAWRGMGWWAYPALGLIILSLALAPGAMLA
ncbi:PepSY-associated TM helix domain-containing protein [Niveispirillum cyanobacteriorum]|uniref:Peptidase n=1 Tax=Niveispirillum cyanobacteriorum TaxID=1612173 RepID=A0A2K9NGN9_9PROT|nr:PepSY-associated TM helix domain-containing protein [Niveispirillum cyanobacteriorum]AUN32269.1 peptidase [Niveispirillum cyanobacteriorum]GGE75815.1 peptidase [Niveispirillum cyanobacteriorum]